MASLDGSIQSGGLERSCAAVRGTTIEPTRAVPIATGINPTTATTTSASVWCCVLPTFFCPFFWSRPRAGRRAGPPGPVAFRKCGPIRVSGFARRGEGRRTAPDRSGPRACREAGRQPGHRPRRAHIETRARPGDRARRCPPPFHHPSRASPMLPLADGLERAADWVCLIQPPRSLPTLATSRLACSY